MTLVGTERPWGCGENQLLCYADLPTRTAAALVWVPGLTEAG